MTPPGPKRAAQRPNRPPPFGFLKGAVLGAIVVIPLVAVSVWIAARLGIGNRSVTMVETIRMAALFGGVAGVLTAGGVGRLAAHASMLPGGRRTAMVRATRAQAVASGGLVLIAAIPLGELPAEPVKWLWLVLAGVVGGALAGALIGFVCGAPFRPRAPTMKDILRAISASASASNLPAVKDVRPEPPKPEPLKPVPEPEPEPEPQPPPKPEIPTPEPPRPESPSLVPDSEPEIPSQKPPQPEIPTPELPKPEMPEPPSEPSAAKKPRLKKRRKAPVTEAPKVDVPAEPGRRAALVTTPPPLAVRLADAAIDTSVATNPSTDAGATPLPAPVPLGDDADEEQAVAKPALPLPAEPPPAEPAAEPAKPPPPPPPARVEHTEVRTDVRTDVSTDVATDVREPNDPTEPRG